MRERGTTQERDRGREGGTVSKKCHFRKRAFILSSSLYFHFMSRRWCKGSSNMCVMSVFEYARVTERACMCVYQGRADCSFISSRAG